MILTNEFLEKCPYCRQKPKKEIHESGISYSCCDQHTKVYPEPVKAKRAWNNIAVGWQFQNVETGALVIMPCSCGAVIEKPKVTTPEDPDDALCFIECDNCGKSTIVRRSLSMVILDWEDLLKKEAPEYFELNYNRYIWNPEEKIQDSNETDTEHKESDTVSKETDTEHKLSKMDEKILKVGLKDGTVEVFKNVEDVQIEKLPSLLIKLKEGGVVFFNTVDYFIWR